MTSEEEAILVKQDKNFLNDSLIDVSRTDQVIFFFCTQNEKKSIFSEKVSTVIIIKIILSLSKYYFKAFF